MTAQLRFGCWVSTLGLLTVLAPAGAARGQSASIVARADVSFPAPVVQARLAEERAGILLASRVTIPVAQMSNSELPAIEHAGELWLTFNLPAVLVVGPYAVRVASGLDWAEEGWQGAKERGRLMERNKRKGSDRLQRQELCVQIASAAAGSVQGPRDLSSGTITVTVSYAGT